MQEIKEIFANSRKAQKKYGTFTQRQVDKIFFEVAKKANQERISLAKLAIEETERGILEDEITKNHFASEFIYNKYKNSKTVGIIAEDSASGSITIVEPMGVITAIIPVTNPTSTAIFKILMAIKTRNSIVISPHPQAKSCTYETAVLLAKIAEKHGAPKNLIQCIKVPSMEGTTLAMQEGDVILATGGGGLVKAAYSSGTPAIGVGAGNAPAIISETADLKQAVASIIQSNMFDNGMVCATENSVIVEEKIYDEVVELFISMNSYVVTASADIEKIKKGMFKEGAFGLLHPYPVGKNPDQLGKYFKIKVPAGTKMILVEAKGTKYKDHLAHEKLSTYVSLYKAKDFEEAVNKSEDLLELGSGHTASLHINEKEKEKIAMWSHRLNSSRLLINTPSSIGGVGDFFNFRLDPSMTLGCGSWGGNSFSGQVGPNQLLNTKEVKMRRENALWLKVPKTYFKMDSTREALKDLIDDNIKKILVVSDKIIWGLYGKKIKEYFNELDFDFEVFTDIEPNPTLASVKKGTKVVESYKPDAIYAFGGGSPMDAGKLMWFMYENPTADFEDLALTFADIRKRIVKFPNTGKKCKFIASPTTAGTGSEVTPFAVITDEKTHKKYPLADYALTPTMAIVDPQFQMTCPPNVTAVSGMDALTHAIESYVSILETEYTSPYSLKAIKLIFEYLPRAVANGADDIEAREKMASAATIAGIAFSNAFLGIVHSMSHKIGGEHGVIHGQANSILLPYVVKYNSNINKGKQAMFSQHKYPVAKEKYAEIARSIGLEGSTDEILVNELIDEILKLAKSIGLHTNFKAILKDKKKFDKTLAEMSLNAFDDQCTGANPRYPLIKDLEQIYVAAFDGTDPKALKI